MDDANIPQTTPEIITESDSEHEADAGQLQTFTEACSAMKEEIATEAQQIITGTEKMGKPPTFTQACSEMKDRMADEAQQLLGVPTSPGKSQTFGDGSEMKDDMASEAQQILAEPEQNEHSQTLASQDLKLNLTQTAEPQTTPEPKIEQAQKALKEASWFEQ